MNSGSKRSTAKAIVLAAALLTITLVSNGCRTFFGDARLSSQVTVESIQQIELGMTQKQAIDLLGAPLDTRRDVDRNRFTLQFSKPVPGARWYPMLWVHLEDGRVIEVYAKRYILWGVDDEGVYGLTQDRRWGAAEFSQTFPASH